MCACASGIQLNRSLQVVDGVLFCVHGGLSPKLKRIDQLRYINRNIEPPQEGLYADLLWSDPDEEGEGYSVRDDDNIISLNLSSRSTFRSTPEVRAICLAKAQQRTFYTRID